MHSRFIWAVSLVTALSMVVGCETESAYQPAPPPKVVIAKPVVKTIPIYHEENGETEAVEQAMVRSRVSGIVEEIKFQPDQTVEKDELLYQIEQKAYLAALESAQAAVSSAEAALASAQADIQVADAGIEAATAQIAADRAEFERMDDLKNSNAISQNEWDTAKAKLGTSEAAKQGTIANKAVAEAQAKNAQAQLDKAKADLRQAELDLEWTKVVAPIAGQINRTLVKEGNLVDPGSELVEITKLNPIWANFNLNERLVLDLEKKHRSEDDATDRFDPTKVKVDLQRLGEKEYLFSGHLDYVDPKINQETSTIQLRAVFDNPEQGNRLLLPGMFVRVRIQLATRENAKLIPERAISRDAVGTYVYVVDAQNIARRKNVVVGPKQDGMIVIEDLGADETVIVDGIQRVRPGEEVDPSS